MGWISKAPSGRWKCGWWDPEGKQRYKTFTRRAEAEAFLAKVSVSRQEGTYVDPSLGKMTLAAFWPRFLAMSPHLRASTRAQYETLSRLYVLPFLGRRQLGSLSRLDVEAWVGEVIEAGPGPATTAASFRLLRRVLSAAEAGDIVARNVAKGVRVPKLTTEPMRFLSAVELAQIADAIRPRYRALVMLLGLSGLRIGEALALRVEDVDLLRRRVSVTKAVAQVRGKLVEGPTKTGANRAVGMPRVVADELARHLTEYPAARKGLIFTNPDGSMIFRTNFRRREWLPALETAGIVAPLPRVHDLRHTSAALAIEAGAHPKSIQAMLGHSSIAVTFDVYGHLFDSLSEKVAEAVDAGYREATAETRERGHG